MVPDNLFSVILNHRLPIRRGNLSISDFLSGYFRDFISDIENALNNRQKAFLQNECYSILANKIAMIRELCDDIIKTFTLYDSADISELHQHFDSMMQKIKDYLYIEHIGHVGSERIKQLYRIREGNSQFNRVDMFHIPMSKRHLIKSYRYSIPGYPCLYLSTGLELCWFECGMPKKFNYSLFQLDVPSSQTIKLISFNRNPVDLVSSIECWYYNKPEERDKIDNYILKYVITHPLRAACSVQVPERSNPFIQEYIIPQLLLLWVRKSNDFDGIAYSSCSAIENAHEWNSFNVVFPAKELVNGYCKRLLELFKVTMPVKVEMCNLFKNRSFEIDKVRDFVGWLEHKYYNGKGLYLYREILSLCKSFILLFDCLSTDNYSNAEAIYQTMDTLNLMSYLITTHTEEFKKHAVREAASLFYGVGDHEIEEDFLRVINDFTNIVKPVLRELWSYASRIRTSIKVDYSSLEKIKLDTEID